MSDGRVGDAEPDELSTEGNAEPDAELSTPQTDAWRWISYPEDARVPAIGDEVHVAPRASREWACARARVTELPDADHAIVRRDANGAHSRVRRVRLTSVLAPDERAVVVCAGTDSFRRLADSQPSPRDALVVELGSSYGDATARLARAVGDAARVVGLEVSATAHAEACLRHPTLRFVRLDCVADKADLALAVREATCLFVDLGGDRSATTLLLLLPFLQRAAPACRLIAIKSEQLHAALPARAVAPAVQTWWAAAHADARARAAAAGATMRTVGLGFGASAQLRHPLQYPRRFTPDGLEICRYHNYRVCDRHRDGRCERDHTTCHVCGERGHIALACRTFAEPSTSHDGARTIN